MKNKIDLKIIILILFVVQTILLSGTEIADQSSKDIFEWYYRIQKLKANGDFQQAISECKKFINQFPHHYKIYILYGQVSWFGKKFSEAENFIKEKICQQPTNPYFPYAMGIFKKIKKKYTEAIEWFKKAVVLGAPFKSVYYELGGYSQQKDIPAILGFFKDQLKKNPENANLYWGIAQIYEYRFKQKEQALLYYDKAIQTAKEADLHVQTGENMQALGIHYYYKGKGNKAIEYYQKAINELKKTAKNDYIADNYINCALIYCRQGDYQKGLDCYNQALAFSQKAGDKGQEAKINRGMGFIFTKWGDSQKGLKCYEKSLNMARAIGDKAAEGQYLSDIAKIQVIEGEYKQALGMYKKALAISRTMNHQFNEQQILNDMGSAFFKTGQYSAALNCYQQILNFLNHSRFKHKINVADLFVNIGNIYQTLNNFEKSMTFYQQALSIFQKMKNKEGASTCLNNMANIYNAQNDYTRALDIYKQSLEISRRINNKRACVIRLINIATVYQRLNKMELAFPYADEALKISRDTGLKEYEVSSLLLKSSLYQSIKKNKQAKSILQKTLKMSETMGLNTKKIISFYYLANIYRQKKDPDQAIHYYKKAIMETEKIRSKMHLTDLKSGFLQEHMICYENLIDCLLQIQNKENREQYLAECFFYLEKAKARSFLDKLQEARINIWNKIPAEFRHQEKQLQKKISWIQTQLIKSDLDPEQMSEFNKKLNTLETEYQMLIQKCKMQNPDYAKLIFPEPYTVKHIQKKFLPAKTAIIEYFIGRKHSFVVFISKRDFSISRLSDQLKTKKRVKNYIHLLAQGQKQPFLTKAAGKRLYEELFKPIKNKIKNCKHLIIIPDQNLHYLPFETLILPNSNDTFLIEKYSISYAPSTSSLVDIASRNVSTRNNKAFLAFANPIYMDNDKQVEKSQANQLTREIFLKKDFQLPPLKYSLQEVEQIGKILSSRKREIYTQAKAKEEKIKSLPLEQYAIIHFATHGLVDEKNPLRSSLVLTLDADPQEDGFLQAREIHQLKLKSDLVVLSACNTGKGKLEQGEGVTGLYRSFLNAGAQSVIMSLWNINDQATSVFMDTLYRHLIQGESKDKALQRTKVAMIKSKFNHPYYWAPFVLNGDWKSNIH